ncbi:MAG: helix-turn-helix transcriptional regulator [Lachnospiraceae bacterium]|nr:helix-turn-helix transcriptional regulator [Lachnospiraceae bacterium]MBR7080656.1 helix-turn-helix transcriptional regulator [Treponema sp.]
MVKNNIRELRKERNLYQKDVAFGIQSDPMTISRYETGEREPRLDMALRLAAFLGVTMDDLFQLESKPKPYTEVTQNDFNHNPPDNSRRL